MTNAEKNAVRICLVASSLDRVRRFLLERRRPVRWASAVLQTLMEGRRFIMSWDKWGQAAERGPAAIFLKAVGLGLMFVIILGVIGFNMNPFRQAGRIINKTIDADNVLYNYEYFKQQWRSVEAIDQKIASQQGGVLRFEDSAGPRSDWSRDDKIEHARLSSIVIGLEQQRADMVAQYNARAAMANRSIFLGNDCPQHIQ